MTLDVSTETLEARRKWSNAIKILSENYLQPKNLHTANYNQMMGKINKGIPDFQVFKNLTSHAPIC